MPSFAYRLATASLRSPEADTTRTSAPSAWSIGAVSLERFSEKARELGISHYELLQKAFGPAPEVAVDLGRSQKAFRSFYEILEGLKAAAVKLLPSDLINVVLEETGYRKSLTDEQTIEAQSRLENLAELRQSIVEFELRMGAALCESAKDVLAYLAASGAHAVGQEPQLSLALEPGRPSDPASPAEGTPGVLDAIRLGANTPDAVCERTGLEISEVQRTIFDLRISGQVTMDPTGLLFFVGG